MEKIRLGFIGLGSRGTCLTRDIFCGREDVEIAAVCDTYPDRVEAIRELVREKKGNLPYGTTDFHELNARADIDAVVVMSAWENHIPAAVDAMENGKPVAFEVGGAYSLDDCWRLVRTHERTGVPCMMLENCCYGRTEMMILHMVELGLFGRVVHCDGGYMHDLRVEVSCGEKNRHYRLRNYRNRNCENYPTHELGPIARVLKLGHGNRMLTLTSTASGSFGLNQFIADNGPDNLRDVHFAQGDIVTTVIRCAGGETITLTLDTTLPRHYSRGFTVHGTKAMYEEANNSLFLDGTHNRFDFGWNQQWGNLDSYREQYEHPLWRDYLVSGVCGGHDGMDYLVCDAFLRSVRENTVPPIDCYDAAAWMSVTALSEESILKGGAPVAIPDFTGGRWTMNV